MIFERFSFRTAQVAGGVPAMCDGVTQGLPGMELSLFSRDTIAMGTAVALTHDVFDAALLLGVCDKIVPGLLIGALHFGHLPCVFVPAGPMGTGLSNNEKAKVREKHAAGLVGRDAQVPLRWFREIYSDFDCDQGTRLGFAFAEHAKLTSFGALSVPLVSAGSVAEVVELLAYLPVITTALIPGKPAPRLVTREMVEAMRPGSVIVDLAVEQGGNCELSKAGEDVVHGGVTILGPANLAATMAHDASALYARNVWALLQLLWKDGQLVVDTADEVIAGCLLTHEGRVVHGPTAERL